MSSSRIVAVAFLVLGIAAFIGGQQGVYYYQDQASKSADDHIAHLSTYRSGDWFQARDGYLQQSRSQRVGFYTVHFGGLILALWAVFMLRRKPQTL